MDIKGRKELGNDMKQNMANNKHNKQIDFTFGKRTSFRRHKTKMSMQKGGESPLH